MKSKYELMLEAGGVLREAFGLIFYGLKPGANLENIDLEVGRYLSDKKAISGLKLMGFPYNMCASLDYEVIQGYPNRVLQEDQIVSIDMSILYKGVYVDKAKSICMPLSSSLKFSLVKNVDAILPTIQNELKSGVRTGFVGGLISSTLSGTGFSSCRYLSGHGIGGELHEEPKIPNYDNGSMDLLEEGQFFTVEPIIYGYPLRRLYFDHEWTITSDELSAHVEETVYMNKNGIEVLT